MDSSRHNLESRYRLKRLIKRLSSRLWMEGVFCSLSSAVVGFYYCRLALLAWSTCPDLFCDLSARGGVDVNIALVHRPVSLSTLRSLRRFWWNIPFPPKRIRYGHYKRVVGSLSTRHLRGCAENNTWIEYRMMWDWQSADTTSDFYFFTKRPVFCFV